VNPVAGTMNDPSAQEKALQGRLETFARQREWRRRRIIEMRQKGAVPAAISDEIDLSLEYVHDVLREAGIELPSYFDQTEHDNEIPAL
jgi:hypothetical protein